MTSPEATAGLRSALRWYMVGFTLLGLAVGFFAGASESPVIGTLLPLLFGLVGGAGGLYLSGANLAEAETLIRMRVLGKALTLFIVCALVSSVYGVSVRTGRSMWSFLATRAVLPEAWTSLFSGELDDPQAALQLVMLRARLRAIGASQEEERGILEAAMQLQTDRARAPTARTVLNRLAMIAGNATSTLDNVLQSPQVRDARALESIRHFRDYLDAYARDFRDWTERIDNGESVPLAFVEHRIDALCKIIEDNLQIRRETMRWLLQQDTVRRNIWEFYWALLDEKDRFGAFGWLDSGEFIEQVDRLIAMLYARRTGETQSSLPWSLPRPAYAP